MKATANNTQKSNEILTISEVYNRFYSKILYRIAYKIQNKSTAEELANDVFIKFNTHYVNEYDPKISGYLTILNTIANNIIIDYYRQSEKRNKTTHVSDFVDSKGNEFFQISDNSSADTSEETDLKNAINKAFSHLKPLNKQIAELLFIEQKSYKEIIEMTGLSESNVKVTINRIRTMLQTELSQAKQLYYSN